jgi:hypothetical protein
MTTDVGAGPKTTPWQRASGASRRRSPPKRAVAWPQARRSSNWTKTTPRAAYESSTPDTAPKRPAASTTRFVSQTQSTTTRLRVSWPGARKNAPSSCSGDGGRGASTRLAGVYSAAAAENDAGSSKVNCSASFDARESRADAVDAPPPDHDSPRE